MRLLVWHWGRRGAGPRLALELSRGAAELPGCTALLSLSRQAEILHGPDAPACDLVMPTYRGLAGLALRVAAAPWLIGRLVAQLRRLRPDAAVCAMPAVLDFLMIAALRLIGVPYVLVVHDARPHPGDRVPLMMALQRHAMHHAAGLVALTGHVAEALHAQGLGRGKKLVLAAHPPFVFAPDLPPPGSHGGKLRLLSFGRLLPYKGLDLLAAAAAQLGPEPGFELRVVGQGPESEALAALRQLPWATVENRWVPEHEVGALLAWSDALVLSHREASQSGVAAAAIAAGRLIVSTNVGGLREQLANDALALLCEPEAGSLAAALRRLPGLRGRVSRGGAGDGWRELAASVLQALPDPS